MTLEPDACGVCAGLPFLVELGRCRSPYIARNSIRSEPQRLIEMRFAQSDFLEGRAPCRTVWTDVGVGGQHEHTAQDWFSEAAQGEAGTPDGFCQRCRFGRSRSHPQGPVLAADAPRAPPLAAPLSCLGGRTGARAERSTKNRTEIERLLSQGDKAHGTS